MKKCKCCILVVVVCFVLAVLVSPSGALDKNCQTEKKSEKSVSECKTAKQAGQTCDVHIVKDLCYLGPERTEKFDLYMPANVQENQRLPGIINIHGGGWRSGDKGSELEKNICGNLARAGYVCISINYLLSEPNKPSWPENLYDCKRAVQFLRKNAKKYNVDPNHIGIIGTSAGGHLSAMVGVTGPEVGLEPASPYKGVSSRVQAVVPFYGVHNFDRQFSDYVGGLIAGFLGASKEDDPNLWAFASPVSHISRDDPPFLIVHGTFDGLVRIGQSMELHEKLCEKGMESQLVRVAGGGHGFDLQPKQQDLRPIVIGFFDKHLKGKNDGEKTGGTGKKD